MLTRPAGVQQRIDFPGGTSALVPVLPYDYKFFSTQVDADNLLANLKTTFPEFTFTMVEDGEEMARFVFTSPNAPKIYLITGVDGIGNVFEECPGYLLTRRLKPEGEDKGGPYAPTDTLKMNLDMRFGYAFFYWSK